MDPRYPVGPFDPTDATPVPELVDRIAAFPTDLRRAVARLTKAQLDTPYREGGWTARQVVHHLADSHLNCDIRFRLALTEDRPVIKPYDQALWAELPDGKAGPIDMSITLLEGVHSRWAALLRAMTPDLFQRSFIHPERGEMTLEHALRLYAWHCRHHLGHIEVCGSR